jgi:hypothetical protein
MARKKKAQDPHAIIPPEALAKLLEVASLLLLADVIRMAARKGKSIVISFGAEGPNGVVLPDTPMNKPEET